jgi:hypothetical protein
MININQGRLYDRVLQLMRRKSNFNEPKKPPRLRKSPKKSEQIVEETEKFDLIQKKLKEEALERFEKRKP